MDVQQGGGNAGRGAGPAGEGSGERDRSRLGLIVGLAIALLAVAGVVLVLVDWDGDDDTGASPSPTATVEVTQTATPTPTSTPTPTPTETEAPPIDPAQAVQLMADSVGPLELRMTKEQALATGAVTEVDTAGRVELIADQRTLPGVHICWDPYADMLTSFLVKDGSPISTPDGIGVGSTVEDLRAAYGVLLQERTVRDLTWYLVPVDDVGYAFFPTELEMILMSGTDQAIEDVRPGSEPC